MHRGVRIGAAVPAAAKISLDSGVLSGVPAEANLIKKGGSGGTNATVSLTDCLACRHVRAAPRTPWRACPNVG